MSLIVYILFSLSIAIAASAQQMLELNITDASNFTDASANVTELDAALGVSSRVFRCARARSFLSPNLPSIIDCNRALMALPVSRSQAHIRPLTLRYGDCKIVIESRMTDVSSWLEVGLGGTQLSLACAGAGGNFATTGGIVELGDHGQIDLSLEYSGSGSGSGAGPVPGGGPTIL